VRVGGVASRRRGGELAAPPSLLHVTNGDSAAITLRQTGIGGAVLAWQDVLHEGPVPTAPRRDLLQRRASFLCRCGWGSQLALLASLERRDLQLRDALHEEAEVVLWFEHDLYDQLQLLDVLTLAADAGPPELIVVGSFPGKPSFAGLGELTAPELETLWPSRRPVTPMALETASAAWAAFRAPAPTALVGWAMRDIEELPFLSPALRRLLEELPAPGDGLSGTERRALQAIAGGADTPGAAFVAAQRLEEAPFLGDTWFFRTLSQLGRGEARLVETDEGRPLPPAPPLGDAALFSGLRLRLTPNGELVTAGDADRFELLDLDRWVGGTHVTSRNAWRWDPRNAELLPPRAP
jgi:hypothetical protein